MITKIIKTTLCLLVILAIALGQPAWGASNSTKNMLVHTNYHGWSAWILSNSQVEVVVVPAIARVMQFRFKNPELEQPFWENRQLDGQTPDPNSRLWRNFGGDKAWIAPQSDWALLTNRDWPPPIAFDATAATVTVEPEAITLISAIDPVYGIQSRRRITLDPEQPVMTITTTYQQVQTSTAPAIAIWIVTQLHDPVTIEATVNRVESLSTALPPSLQVHNGQLSLNRDRARDYKIGCDASRLRWIGKEVSLEITAPRIKDAEYCDRGSSAEIYTNPDPLTYVELEFLSPLTKLQLAESINHTVTYTLSRI